MLKRAHLVAGMLAPLCLVTFFVSTLLTELLGSQVAVAQLKALIVTPGLWIMIPAVGSSRWQRHLPRQIAPGRLVDAKKKRMPFIAANGLLVLVPWRPSCWTDGPPPGRYDAPFYAVQLIELVAGAINLVLMGLNARDGLRLAGRLPRGRRPSPVDGQGREPEGEQR